MSADKEYNSLTFYFDFFFRQISLYHCLSYLQLNDNCQCDKRYFKN